MDSIPVIGTAVVNNPYWVTRLLASIDYPVDNFVIINNNGRGEIDQELDNLVKMTHKFVRNMKVCHMPANIGCGGAWNLIIKCYMMASYWIIVNDDVAFNPGLLNEMHTLMVENPDLGLINPNAGDYGVGAWDLFAIRDIIIQEFGLFDENTYPAYNEDADYIMRLIHRPIKKVIGTQRSYQHGNAPATNYYGNGSQTQVSEGEEIRNKLDAINAMNIDYLTEKWGSEWRVCNPWLHPFNKEDVPLDYTPWDLEYVRMKHLGF